MVVNILRLFDSRMHMNVERAEILDKLVELDKGLRYKHANNTAHLTLGVVEYRIRFAVYPTPSEVYRLNGMCLSLFVCDMYNEEVDHRLRMLLREAKFSLKHKAVAICLGGKNKKYFDEDGWQ